MSHSGALADILHDYNKRTCSQSHVHVPVGRKAQKPPSVNESVVENIPPEFLFSKQRGFCGHESRKWMLLFRNMEASHTSSILQNNTEDR